MCKKFIPADVPKNKHCEFLDSYCAITKCKNKLFIFAADHKMEHLAKDFYGPNMNEEVKNPEHLFKIASQGKIGAFASHLGLISRYANNSDYKNINYIVKLNGKTNLLTVDKYEPISSELWTVQDVVNLKENSGLNICGVGYTIYLGSEHENIMLKEAAQIISQAHQNGLIAILWIYPRGKNIPDSHDGVLNAGAAGIATSLGADFVKLYVPHREENKSLSEILNFMQDIAGNTKIILSGGEAIEPEIFLEQVYNQINSGKVYGAAVGRNIYKHKLDYAIKMTQAIYGIIYDNLSLGQAIKILK